MRYIPFRILEEIPGKEPKFWSLICSDEHFYRLTRAYNTVNQIICDIELNGEGHTAFDLNGLRRERVRLKDEIFYLLSH